MPPKAKAKGVAAKARAKAAFAGKAKAQSAGLGKGGGAGPQGTLLPAGPAPEATRRWVHCGWDADYYDKEVALAAPGELIEAVMQDANGAARGCLLVEVIGAPSQLNLQGMACIGEEGCVFPVRFMACEDAGIADWAADAFVAGGTELFLPKQYEVDNERLVNVGVIQCARWRWRPAGHFPEAWVPDEVRSRAPAVVPPLLKAAPKARAPLLPVAPPAPKVAPAAARTAPGRHAAPAYWPALPRPTSSVQVLAGQFGGCAPPRKLGAAPGYGIYLTGFLPPLSREGAQGLPAAPGEAGAIAARPGKKEKTEKKPGKKKVVNDVLLHRAKGTDYEDASEENPSPSEERTAVARFKMKRAKDEEKHRGSSGSSSSSDDMRAELFRDAASLGSLVNIQRVAQESPGALLDSGLKAMRRFLDPGSHQGSGDRKHGRTPHVTQYLTTVALALQGRELGLRSERELRTLSEALDHLLLGNLDACGDILMQRFKAVELAGIAGWAVASRMELIAQRSVSAFPSEEREAALTREGEEKKLRKLAYGLRKGKSWAIGRGNSAEGPAVTLRPSSKARASFPAAALEGTAGKKKKRRGGAA